jgi:hypothetical protein
VTSLLLQELLLLAGLVPALWFIFTWGRYLPKEHRFDLATFDAVGWVFVTAAIWIGWLAYDFWNPTLGDWSQDEWARIITIVAFDTLLVGRAVRWHGLRQESRAGALETS